jgi:hypothetical protein
MQAQAVTAERRLLSVADLARETGESLSIWRARISRREITSVRCGRNIRIRPRDYEEWVSHRLIPSTAGNSE